MKKNIGAKLALYPTPLVVVGTMVNGKPNWTLVGHLGIIGHDRVMVSMSDSHYSNQGIRAMKNLSINIVDEAMLKEADYAGASAGQKRINPSCLPITSQMAAYRSLTLPLFPWSARLRMSTKRKALRASSARSQPPMRRKPCWMTVANATLPTSNQTGMKHCWIFCSIRMTDPMVKAFSSMTPVRTAFICFHFWTATSPD